MTLTDFSGPLTSEPADHRLRKAFLCAGGVLLLVLGQSFFLPSDPLWGQEPRRTVQPVPEERPSVEPAPAEPPSFVRPSGAPKHVPNQLLVRFRPGVPQSWKGIAHGSVGAKVLKSFAVVDGLQLVQLPPGTSVEAAIQEYRKHPEVLYAEPNYIVHALVEPNDPNFVNGTQWDLNNTGQNGGVPGADIHGPQAWDITTGSNSVVVAVIDTGIDYNHPDLAANVFNNTAECNGVPGIDDDLNGFIDDCHGINAITLTGDPLDDNNHGTHVSGTIGAVSNNGMGVAGINWNVKILACKFLGAGGSGSSSDAITCFNYVALMKDRGVNIIATNNSWGGGGFSQALSDAIDADRLRGILTMAAAGNATSNNDTFPHFPANYYLPNVIAVASTTRTDAISFFSNFGRRTVHLGAPGSSIISTTRNNTYSIFSGTSMATPHVTGVAALLKAQDPSRDWKAIKNLILAGGDATAAMTGNTVTGKRLSALGSMTCFDSPLSSRLQPFENTVFTSVGTPIMLAALSINCARPGRPVQVLVNSGAQTIPLADDGVAPDQESGDGIYSGQFTPAADQTTTLTFPGNDVVTVSVLHNYSFSSTPFSYRNISGTNLDLDDDTAAQITSPFPILFGGGNFTNLFVGSNGIISFDTPVVQFVNDPLPTSVAQTLAAPFWDDLLPTPGTGQNVFWEVSGTAPNRELVVEWRDVRTFACGSDPAATIRFQVVFFEGSSDVLFNYADTIVVGACTIHDRGGSATVGIQVSPSLFNQFSFNTQSLNDGTALLWQVQSTPNPVATASTLLPSSIVAGGPAFTLTVLGSDFVPTSVVRWNGSPLSTSFVSDTQLQAAVPAANISSPGTASVTVFNPAPAGGTSGSLTFTITTPPNPSLSSLFPFFGFAGGAGFTLTVNGRDFGVSSLVRWNGVDRPTTFVNLNQLTAAIPASDLAVAPGTASVTVLNPAAAGPSNALTFTIRPANPAPTIASLSSLGVPHGTQRFSFLVNGTNFVLTSTVRWNGVDRPTTFISGSQLRVFVTASDLASAGSAQVTVFNPPPGGGTSSSATFNVTSLSTRTVAPKLSRRRGRR